MTEIWYERCCYLDRTASSLNWKIDLITEIWYERCCYLDLILHCYKLKLNTDLIEILYDVVVISSLNGTLWA